MNVGKLYLKGLNYPEDKQQLFIFTGQLLTHTETIEFSGIGDPLESGHAAEIHALSHILEAVTPHQFDLLEIFSNSLFVVNRMKEEWKPIGKNEKVLQNQILLHLKKIGRHRFHWEPDEEQFKHARLAQHALNQALQTHYKSFLDKILLKHIKATEDGWSVKENKFSHHVSFSEQGYKCTCDEFSALNKNEIHRGFDFHLPCKHVVAIANFAKSAGRHGTTIEFVNKIKSASTNHYLKKLAETFSVSDADMLPVDGAAKPDA